MSDIVKLIKIVRLALALSMLSYVLYTMAGMIGVHDWYYSLSDTTLVVYFILTGIAFVLFKFEKRLELMSLKEDEHGT